MTEAAPYPPLLPAIVVVGGCSGDTGEGLDRRRANFGGMKAFSPGKALPPNAIAQHQRRWHRIDNQSLRSRIRCDRRRRMH
jgi:hypothetical protein